LWVFGLINFLNFAKIFQKLGSKNKLKDSGKMKHLLMFSNKGRSSGRFISFKGKWNADFFKNDNPVVLELGCGKGEYSVGLAERYLIKISLELILKELVFWRGAKTMMKVYKM
jgi:tRNA (guanine-N7-)-methyltransferase